MASTVTELLRRRFGGKSLPYDAEIEYLGCDGNQYIDTALIGGLNTKIEVSALTTALGLFFAGVRPSNNNGITLFAQNNGTQRFGDKSAVRSYSTNARHVVSISKDNFIYDGNSQSISATTQFTTAENIYLMWASYQASSTSRLKGNFYYAKIWENNVLVRDMIPVRVGTTGYMYDKVSGQLFANAGTGDFTLGNDK